MCTLKLPNFYKDLQLWNNFSNNSIPFPRWRSWPGGWKRAAARWRSPACSRCTAPAWARPAVFVCGDEREAQQLRGDLQTLLGAEPVVLLGREWQLRPGAIASRDWERSRLAALYALSRGEAPVTVATADALCARTLPPKLLHSLALTLEVGARADLNELADRLVSAGYTRCQQVEGVG